MTDKQISEIMLAAQQSLTPLIYVRKLRKVYDKLGFDHFFKEYMRCLKHLLLDKSLAKQNPYVDTGLEFCVMFSTSFQSKEDDSTALFLVATFREVLQLSNVGQTRYRVCYFINLLLQQLAEGLDEDICFNIRDAMLERIKDIKPAVQILAIEILQKLQDPFDPDDQVVKALLHAFYDPSALVRRTVIRCVGINGCTIPAILKRCKDVHYLVRHAAYDRVSKLHIRMVKIEQRQHLIACGLNDVHKKVVNHVKTALISNWLANCGGNYFDFVTALRLDADDRDWTRTEEVVELSLNTIFKEGVLKDLMEILPLGPNRVITSVGKNWEQIAYWRCIVKYLKSDKTFEDLVDRIMPDLSIFCVYIRSVHDSRNGCKQPHDILEHHQIMYELLLMLKQFDLSDEVGRNSVHKLITDLLTDTNHLDKNLILMIDILEELIPNLDIRFEEISDLIYNIRNPLIVRSPPRNLTRQRDVKVAEIRVKLNIATDDQEQAIERTDFQEAERLKHVISDLHVQMKQIQDEFIDKLTPKRASRNDVQTLCQCLDILIAAMRSMKVKKMPVAVFKLHEEFVQPLTVSYDPDIKSRVLKFYPLLGIIDKSVAISTLHLSTNSLMKYKVVPSTDVELTLLALYGITDLLLMYGSSILSKEPEKQRSQKRLLFNEASINETGDFSLTAPVTLLDIIDTISSMLDDTIMQVREKACESILKLMYNQVIQSVMILSKLVLKWFNPATAKDARILQLLGKFFTEYFTCVRGSVNLTHKLFVPTLTAIVDAPKYSPLAEIEILTVIKFLIEVCRPNQHSVAIGLDAYKLVSLTLCREIMERPNNKVTLAYMKTLVLLNPPYDDAAVMQDLRSQADLMVDLIKDKGVIKYLDRYRRKLDGNMSEGVTDQSTDVASGISNETYLSLTETSMSGEDDQRLSNDEDDNEDTIIQDISLEPEDDVNITVIHNVPDADTSTPVVTEGTTKAMKRRKIRGRLEQKQTENMVGDSATAPSNDTENNEDDEQEGQVMVVETDSDPEQPRAKAHMPETRATPSRKAKTKAYKPTEIVTRAKKSMTGSDMVLKSADSEQEQPTTSKQMETRNKKGGRKSNVDSNKADSKKDQPNKPKGTAKRGKKGGRKSNAESEAKLPATDSDSDQPAAQLNKTDKQGKRGGRKSNIESTKVLETVDPDPEPEDTQNQAPVRRRSRRKKTSRKLDE